jgi:hypothetical protein
MTSAEIEKSFAYLWNLKERRIKKLEVEARHPYAKVQDKVDADRVGRKRVLPRGKKDV